MIKFSSCSVEGIYVKWELADGWSYGVGIRSGLMVRCREELGRVKLPPFKGLNISRIEQV